MIVKFFSGWSCVDLEKEVESFVNSLQHEDKVSFYYSTSVVPADVHFMQVRHCVMVVVE